MWVHLISSRMATGIRRQLLQLPLQFRKPSKEPPMVAASAAPSDFPRLSFIVALQKVIKIKHASYYIYSFTYSYILKVQSNFKTNRNSVLIKEYECLSY